MRRLVALFRVRLFLIPGFALAQVPTYTLVDLGAVNVPNNTNWPDADCNPSNAGTDSQGHPVYLCNSWDSDASGTLMFVHVSVGYALVAANQPQPVEFFDSCCDDPDPRDGLNALPLPAALQSFPAEAISISEGGQYAVGYATHTDQTGHGSIRSAILWNNEAAAELPALSGSGIQYDSAAYSANEWGEVVGESLIPLSAGGSAERATLWIGNSAHELQYMLSPYVPVILTTARLIDCSGNIGAQGWPISIGAHPYSSNYPHTYLLLRQGAAHRCQY